MIQVFSWASCSTLGMCGSPRAGHANRLIARSLGSLLLLSFIASVAHGAAIKWELQSVIFSDGAFGTGSFVYEAITHSFRDWKITTSVSNTFGGFVYTPTTSQAIANAEGCALNFIATASHSQFLCLNPASTLEVGATPQLLRTSIESFPGGVRVIASGSLSDPPPGGGDAVPEPATCLFTALALATIIGTARRHLASVRAT